MALDFYAPTGSVVGALVRDALFFAVIAFGIAINAVLLNAALAWIISLLRRR